MDCMILRITVLLALLFGLTRGAVADDITDCHTGDGAKLTNPAFWDTAIAACTRLIAMRSGASQAASYAARAAWLRRQNKFDAALADIDRALSINPKEVEFYDTKADICLDKGDIDRAIATYDQAIRMDPTYGAAYTSRGVAYNKKGDIARARDSYYAALATPETRAGDRTGLQKWAHVEAHRRLAMIYQNNGDYDRAIAEYGQAIKLEPNSGETFNSRCWARAIGNRELQQALADCNESLRLQPNAANTLDSRGFVYFRLSQYDQAIADYDAALKLAPKLAGSLYVRGLAKLQKGDSDAGNADIAAAKALQVGVAEMFAKYGVIAPDVTAATTQAAADCAQAETHWKGALALNILAGYEDHLKRFPDCAFADLAKLKIEELRK